MLDSNFTNKGYGQEPTAYRWRYGAWNSNYNNIKLICSSKSDSFSTKNNAFSNNNLRYPISMLSSDEIIAGGAWWSDNSAYFLYSGVDYWTLSAYYFNGYNADMRYVRQTGSIDGARDVSAKDYGVKPTINVSANSLTSGDGTINNPYTVE